MSANSAANSLSFVVPLFGLRTAVVERLSSDRKVCRLSTPPMNLLMLAMLSNPMTSMMRHAVVICSEPERLLSSERKMSAASKRACESGDESDERKKPVCASLCSDTAASSAIRAATPMLIFAMVLTCGSFSDSFPFAPFLIEASVVSASFMPHV
jgi:hypothetical protein